MRGGEVAGGRGGVTKRGTTSCAPMKGELDTSAFPIPVCQSDKSRHHFVQSCLCLPVRIKFLPSTYNCSELSPGQSVSGEDSTD